MTNNKIALCFIISYDHVLNKEDIWKEWISFNADIINVYFYYKERSKIQSPWILKHAIPLNYIHKTSYFHVIPAYLSSMAYAMSHDSRNQWFCMLTDSCCPIISPTRFRFMFYQHCSQSILSWRKAWWNITFHRRANLALLPQELRLANDPWFVLTREHIYLIMNFYRKNEEMARKICEGGLANESLFAIALHSQGELLSSSILNTPSHAADWSRMASTTSPHVFKEANETDTHFIENCLKTSNHKFLFIRKVHRDFPDDVLKYYIYDFPNEEREKKEIEGEKEARTKGEIEARTKGVKEKSMTDLFIDIIYQGIAFLVIYFLLVLFYDLYFIFK